MNNVLIIGCGPVGIATACILATNRELKITVIDKRPQPTRSHGLSIHSNSIAKVVAVIDDALAYTSNKDELSRLKTIFSDWSDGFVRTNDIEVQLADQAKRMGVKVRRRKAYEIHEGDLEKYLDPDNTDETRLKTLILDASVIIACDGAKSTIRKELDIQYDVDEELKYMAELKYQTNGTAQQRSKIQASSVAMKTGVVGVEILNRRQTSDKKPATYLAFIDKETFDELRVEDEEGKIKGVYGNTWTLAELRALSASSTRIRHIHTNFERYLQSAFYNGGHCSDDQIATLELRIYRNAKSVCREFGKLFIFVGDANSGLIYQRGYNKGLEEAALCGRAFSHLLSRTSPQSGVIPEEFLQYERDSRLVFEREREQIYRRNTKIKIAEKTVQSTATSYALSSEVSDKMSDASTSSTSTSKDWFSSLFSN